MNTEFFKFEDKEYDIPLYNNNPPINSKKIIVLFAGLLITFLAVFMFPIRGYQFPKAVVICLATLIPVWYALDGNLSEIFKKPKLSDIKFILIGVVGLVALALILNLILTGGTAAQTDNAVNGSPIILLISAIIQLVGEELLKFIALVLVMIFIYKALGRKGAIALGIIISQLIFAFFHIPAYGFDIVRLVVSIGIGSVILPIIYVKTKSITVTYLTHLINDLLAFLPLIFSAVELLAL